MFRHSGDRRADDHVDGPTASESWLFAQALLGQPIRDPNADAQRARQRRELLDFTASISSEHEQIQHSEQRRAADALADRRLLEWVAAISPNRARELRSSVAAEAEQVQARRRANRFLKSLNLQEAPWDPAKHPRLGGPPNAGWFATTGGSWGTSGVPSTFEPEAPPNGQPDELFVTPDMMRTSRWADAIHEKLQLAGEIATAFFKGLGTGAKAVVNGLATAARSVATLGLNTDQLELIGVTDEDRALGYDTAVTISTGSGQILIAVGTGGLASALAKGGTVARAGSGALVAYDAAGNVVGVVQGVYDATQNGVTLANGTQVAAGALGITANIGAAKSLATPRTPTTTAPATTPNAPAATPATGFFVGKHGDMPSPRPGQHTVSAPRSAGPRSFMQRLADYTENPGAWKPLSLHAEPAISIRARRGVSEQIIYRHAETGETLIRHRVTDARGHVLGDHFRPYYKPRIGEVDP